MNVETGETWILDNQAIQSPSDPQDLVGIEGWRKIDDIDIAIQNAKKTEN
ncbi:hypothetical protein [Luteolibacter sp. AS25]